MNSSPGSTQDKNTNKRNHNQQREMRKQHDAKHGMICEMWHAMHMRAPEGKEGSRNQLGKKVCRWKDEMISVEIDIKITGMGCTVCKWQAKQEWHNSAINSTTPSRMQQETKLLHSNIATKHMAVIYSRCLTKDEHWATAKSHKSRFKQAWQKCKRYQLQKLSENTNMSGINIRKQCLE